MAEQAAAGWYPDGQGQERYWDGATWTDQLRQRAGVEPEGESRPSAVSRWGSAAKKVATDKLAEREVAKRKHAEAEAAAGLLVTSGTFGTSTVEIYEGGFVRVSPTMSKSTPYEKLRFIKYTPPATETAAPDPLPGALGSTLAGLVHGGKALMKGTAPGLMAAGLAHVASVGSRTSLLTISTDLTTHSLTNEGNYEFIKNVNSHHNQVGLVLEEAGNGVLRALGVITPAVPTTSAQFDSATPAVGHTTTEPSLADRLRELAGVHSEGLLSDEEYAEAKRRIISGM